jgi:RNA polymerase sigma factor for flagellar operon FliA
MSAAPSVREQTLVRAALHVVERAAGELEKAFPGRVRAPELLAVGTFALYRAASAFDEELSHDFRDYAYHRTRFAMLDALRLETKNDRRLRAAMKASDLFLATYRNDEVSVFDDDETVKDLVSEGAEALLAATFAAMVEEQQRIDEEDPVAEVEEHRVACEALEVAMGALTEEQRRLLTIVYRELRTLEDATGVLGLSYATVRRRHADALARLRDELGKLGVDRAPPPLKPSLRLVR